MAQDAVIRPRQSAPFLSAVASESASRLLSLDALRITTTLTPLFRLVIVLLAVFWLFYRAYQVLNKPLEELASLLGFDLPSAPTVDLASIKADGAILHWSLLEKHKSKASYKYEVHVNGIVIDTLSTHESAATITGLQPGCFYVVRVALLNNVEFSSRSAPIRFRTKAANTGDFFVLPVDGHETDHDVIHEPIPRVRPFRGLKDVTTLLQDPPPITREHSSGSAPKRGVRKSSPAHFTVDKHDPSPEDGEPPEGAETIQQLTRKLDAIRRETDETEKQAKEEEEEEMQQKEELSKERDELKAEVMEKEKASRNLKREVNALERQNTAAQNERTKHERAMQQKKQDRQKLIDDTNRWEREAGELKTSLEETKLEKVRHLQEKEEEKDKLRKRQTEEVAALKALDEEAKEKSLEIKKLERAMKNHSPNDSEPEPNLVQQLQQDAEEKRSWDAQHNQLQQQYAITAQRLEQAKRFHAEQVAYLETVRARRRQEEANQYAASPPSTQERLPRRGDSQRSRRAQSGNSSTESPHLAGFPMTSAPFGPSMTSTSAAFSAAPFLNIHNGMTISGPTEEIVMSEEDRERLTGGALMSPGAGADLLPADLFGEGDNKLSSDFVTPLPGLGALPGLPGIPGPVGHPFQDNNGPASPTSGSSRSPSVFASPQASQQNLHVSSPEHVIDADRRSIRSSRSNRAPSGSGTGSRFSGMFGIRQRNKAPPSADDGLALGKAQSHSMPRQDQGMPGIDSASRKRNSSISGTVLSDTFADSTTDASAPPAGASRRSRALNFFNRDKNDGWPSTFTSFGRRPASPGRPGSTHSSELPRPSMDSSRWGVDTWPSGDAASGARSSPLAFGAGWNVPATQPSRMFGSRHPSRRPSQQYSGNGPHEDILENDDDDVDEDGEDDDSDSLDSQRAAQLGAIGTRPPSRSKKVGKMAAALVDPPRLNPNAKDFKSFFSGMKLTGKDKGRDGNSSTYASSANADKSELEDMSPPNSRKSKDTRDTRSLNTTESSIAESGRNSADLARTPSYSTSDAPAPSPLLGGSSAGKESFMQKLSRKSSSSKFTLPTFKREKSRMDASTTPTSAPADDEEEPPLSASWSSLGGGRDSREAARGSGRNWSNVLKLGKKKGNETPSLSGMSMTSGTEDGEEKEMS